MDREDEQGDLSVQKKVGRGTSMAWVAMARTVRGQSAGQGRAGQGMDDGSVHLPDLRRLCSGFGQAMGPTSCIKYLQLEANSNFA